MALPTYKDIVDLMKKGATVEAQEQIMALSGKKRFSELERSLVSISPKVLTERLRELEAKQIVCRTVFPTVPPTTEYELTSMGKDFETVIRAMQDFGTLLLNSAESPKKARNG